jgi:predicted AlkP superfamily pyrophosphatase or phosphodiesterase
MQHQSIAHSAYSKVMFKGANNIPYENYGQMLENLVLTCSQEQSSKSYFYVYFGEIDSMGHRHGIDSPAFEEALDHCWKALEEHYWKPLQKLKKKVATIVIADHGMVAVNPKSTIYLNQELPQLQKSFKKNKRGKLLAPAGSCRDFFLHIEDNDLVEVQEILRGHFLGKAEIYTTKELIEWGFFGEGTPCQEFFSRVGNLVILPYEHEAIWWYEKGRFEQHFYAAHGGLTRKEMETIFLFLNHS